MSCYHKIVFSPVETDGHQSEDGGRDGQDGDELCDLAVDRAKRPVEVVEHVREVEDDVEGGIHSVCDAKVHYEYISNCSHSWVC